MFIFAFMFLLRIAEAQEVLTLEDCLRMTIENNLSLKGTRNEIVKGLHNIDENRARLMPQVNAVAAFNDNFDPPVSVTDGSAYGKDGLLGRWRFYVDSLHGNNKLMKDLICKHPDRYKHFQFSVLQILSKSTPDEEIIHAEALWKKKLCSVQFGMNDN